MIGWTVTIELIVIIFIIIIFGIACWFKKKKVMR